MTLNGVIALTAVYLLQRKCRPQNLVFSDISFTAILAGVTPSESDKVRHIVSLVKI